MNARLPFLPIAKPMMGEEELAAVKSVLDSGWLTQGPWVKKFEEAFAARHGVRHAFAATSCTTALHLALVAAGIGPGDEVIVPAFTWVATANVVVHCGATPVFVDIRADSFNIDPDAVVRALTTRTRAIIPVHLFGLMADMDALAAVLPPGVIVLEDAACAAGAAYRGRPAGSIGNMAAFSLHPRKSVTCGEGGVVTTNDSDLARRIDTLRNHGASVSEEVRARGAKPYELPDFSMFGFNYRLTDLQASVATVQLAKLDRFIAERHRLADAYDARLQKIGWVSAPTRPADIRHALQAYVVMVDEARAPASRNAILQHLQDQGIGGRPGTHSVVGLSAYRDRFGTAPSQFPVSTRAEAQSMALPLHNHMNEADVERVVAALESIA
jgi:perosamine synthetase